MYLVILYQLNTATPLYDLQYLIIWDTITLNSLFFNMIYLLLNKLFEDD